MRAVDLGYRRSRLRVSEPRLEAIFHPLCRPRGDLQSNCGDLNKIGSAEFDAPALNIDLNQSQRGSDVSSSSPVERAPRDG